MYIISKQKDYYDGVVGSVGIDKTIVYERVAQEIESNKDYPKTIVELADGDSSTWWDTGLNRYHVKKDQKKFDGNCAFIVGFCGKLYVGWKFYREIKRQMPNNSDWKVEFTYDGEYNTPAFVYDCDWSEDNFGGNYRHSFVINPKLKDLQFYKVFDAFTAFQEISMFLGGVLGVGEKEIIEIEDKYKIGQHGFDKWSFRKEPTKKKGRR